MFVKSSNKNDKYTFRSDNIKVEFSNPTIQAHDENGYCKNEKGILYYYYTVKAWVRENKKWNKIFEINPYDFPTILDFKAMLKCLIDDEIKLDYYQVEKTSTGTWFTYHCDMGLFAEDTYSVTHSFMEKDDERIQERYVVTVGKPLDLSNKESLSVRFNNLKKEDLQSIFNCVNGFISYTISKNNEIVVERNKKGLSSWKVVDGKLYKMCEDGKAIDSVYIVGDVIDEAVVLKGSLDSTDFMSYRYHKFEIISICDYSIILNSGYIEDEKGVYTKVEGLKEIYLNTLLNLYDDVSDEKLNLDEEGIINDFMPILSNKEKEEFRKESNDFLFEKWKSAIMNRTWMCRSEHNLPKRVKDKGNHENVYASIRTIIKTIQLKVQ